jgi:hypothetical protein
MEEESARGFIADFSKLPPLYPTHLHDAAFWACLGRAVATFGFLEEVAKKAVFALTGSREVPADKAESALDEWHTKLEKTIVDPLGGLIDTFQKAAKSHPKLRFSNFKDLEEALREAARMRNVICHGSWRPPNNDGTSVPFFVTRQPSAARKLSKKGKPGNLVVFEQPVDVAWLEQLQRHTTELACEVMNTVTHMGYQFPGSGGPGQPL